MSILGLYIFKVIFGHFQFHCLELPVYVEKNLYMGRFVIFLYFIHDSLNNVMYGLKT